MEYVLGVDIGTGSIKAVAVDMNGLSFAESQQSYGYSAPKPGYHEQHPEQIWNAFVSTLKKIIDKTGAQPLAIGLSSAMHSLIAVDEDCIPLAPMITWADNRSSGIAERLRATDTGIAIYQATGTPLHAMSPLCKIIWIRENDPELFSTAHKFISIKEYIWHKLFKEFTIDHSLASCTGLFDIVQLKWHYEALAAAGISDNFLSDPVPTDYNKVYIPESELAFIKQPISITIGASDGCLANLGSMATKPGIAAITIGTSGAVRVASNIPLPNPKAMTFSYILDKQTFICGGPVNNGGVAMQWWLKNIAGSNAGNEDYQQMFDQISGIPAGSEGLLFLPYLTGERAPIWDSDSCGNFFGIKLRHKQANFSRAVMEGICYALKDVLDAVQQNSVPIAQINISGGFTKSEIWVQTLADITGIILVNVQADDASAVGAAFIVLRNLRAIDDYPVSTQSELNIFHPNSQNAEVYKNGFAIYKELYTVLKETMHKVNNQSM